MKNNYRVMLGRQRIKGAHIKLNHAINIQQTTQTTEQNLYRPYSLTG